MTTYRSVPVTVEARQWNGHENNWLTGLTALTTFNADQIVAWIEREGGHARYERQTGERPEHLIAVRTSTGRDAFALPGWWIVRTDEIFKVRHGGARMDSRWTSECRAFVVVRDLSELRIEHQWEVVDE